MPKSIHLSAGKKSSYRDANDSRIKTSVAGKIYVQLLLAVLSIAKSEAGVVTHASITNPLSDVTFDQIFQTNQEYVTGIASVSIAAYGATASASGNSAKGTLKAIGSSSPFVYDDLSSYTRGIGSVEISDILTFSGTQAFNALMRVTLLGDLYDPALVGVIYSSQADSTFSMYTYSLGGIAISEYTIEMWADNCGNSGTNNCVVGNHFRKVIEVPFFVASNQRDVVFGAALNADGMMGGSANFGSSAYLELVGLPEDVSFSSSTGFLTDPSDIPPEIPVSTTVSEPISILLVATGFLGALFSLRSRRNGHRVQTITREGLTVFGYANTSAL